ncbi:hypothetical protein MVEN_00847200 [Mycena venus]|uniref:DUF6534 domain-containing protein n=1 Tax=Mycena venus TaxID=2733690 RepID=A0A8H7D3G0_9AGAR|nr:hypothetical protein MVEN_00847200 [Mycena venus]
MPGVTLLFGPMLIGVVLNMILYGAMFTQMVRYYQLYTHDSMWIRYFMLYLLLVETAGLIVEAGIIYEPLITQFGKEVAITISPKLLPGDSILIVSCSLTFFTPPNKRLHPCHQCIVSAPIQLFTAWRISVITQSLILPGIIALLSLGSFGAGIAVSAIVSTNPEFQNFAHFTSEVTLWLVLSAVCDIVIAVGMTHALYTRKTGFSAVDGQINRIIRLTVETGALTAITALVDLMLFPCLSENIDELYRGLPTLEFVYLLDACDVELSGAETGFRCGACSDGAANVCASPEYPHTPAGFLVHPWFKIGSSFQDAMLILYLCLIVRLGAVSALTCARFATPIPN